MPNIASMCSLRPWGQSSKRGDDDQATLKMHRIAELTGLRRLQGVRSVLDPARGGDWLASARSGESIQSIVLVWGRLTGHRRGAGIFLHLDFSGSPQNCLALAS